MQKLSLLTTLLACTFQLYGTGAQAQETPTYEPIAAFLAHPQHCIQFMGVDTAISEGINPGYPVALAKAVEATGKVNSMEAIEMIAKECNRKLLLAAANDMTQTIITTVTK